METAVRRTQAFRVDRKRLARSQKTSRTTRRNGKTNLERLPGRRVQRAPESSIERLVHEAKRSRIFSDTRAEEVPVSSHIWQSIKRWWNEALIRQWWNEVMDTPMPTKSTSEIIHEIEEKLLQQKRDSSEPLPANT